MKGVDIKDSALEEKSEEITPPEAGTFQDADESEGEGEESDGDESPPISDDNAAQTPPRDTVPPITASGVDALENMLSMGLGTIHSDS